MIIPSPPPPPPKKTTPTSPQPLLEFWGIVLAIIGTFRVVFGPLRVVLGRVHCKGVGLKVGGGSR